MTSISMTSIKNDRMKSILRSALLALTAAVGLAALPAVPAEAQTTKLKLVLNWKYQGPQGMFFLADDKGYFKEEGLEVTLDQGNGSGAAVPLVANGTYDVGFGDINALIELAAKKPEDAPIAVYVMFNQPPFTVAVKADSPIKTPKDFEGKTLGGAANDGALKLFPALCKLAKIDCAKVNITNMQPNLREQMLMQGQVDGVFGYVNTIRFSAKLMGVEDSQLRFINFGDYGMDLYSNAIIVSKKLVKENPKAVAGLVRAINRGLIDSLKDIDASVAAVAKREPLIKIPVERERFVQTLKDEMNHPEIAKIGLGNVDPERLKKSIDILVDASSLPRTPAVAEIFTPAFLPPVERPAEEAVLAAAAPALRLSAWRSGARAARTQADDTTGTGHGPSAQRARCDDHRSRQGHGRGDHHGLRRRGLEARAGRARRRGGRAGGAGGAGARRRSDRACRATSPMRSNARRPRPRPSDSVRPHRHPGERRRRLGSDRQDRRRDHAGRIRRHRHAQHERLLPHHARRAADHDGAALRQDRQCRRHLRDARPRRPHGLFGVEVGPARHHQELRARGRLLQHQRQLRRARHGRRPALPRQGLRRHGEEARHHASRRRWSATPPTMRSSA